MRKIKLFFLLVFALSFNLAFSQSPSGCGSSNWPSNVSSGILGVSTTFTAPIGGDTYRWEVFPSTLLQIVNGSGDEFSVEIEAMPGASGIGTVYVTRYEDGVNACTDQKEVIVGTVSQPCPDDACLTIDKICEGYSTAAIRPKLSCAENVSSITWRVEDTNGSLLNMASSSNSGNSVIQKTISIPDNYYGIRVNLILNIQLTGGNSCTMTRLVNLKCLPIFIPLRLNTYTTRKNIKISPNPSQGIFNIQNEEDVNISKINILNSQGELIQQSSNHNSKTTLDLSNENSGVYFVKIRFDDGSFETEKLILVR